MMKTSKLRKARTESLAKVAQQAAAGRLVGVIFVAMLTTAAGAQAEDSSSGNPQGIVVSGKVNIPPVAEAVRPSSPSSPGYLAPGQARDSLANIKAGRETEAAAVAKARLEGVSAPIGRESVIGADTRIRVNPTTTYPARATVLITFSAGRCTGWLINANTVVTAGHCVHPGNGTTFYPASSYRIYPGYTGSAAPYGSCTAKWLASVQGWTKNGDDRFDYGAIKLNCSIGNTTGYFGFFWTSASLTGLPTLINGYPGDKPLTQWRSSDLVRLTQAQRVFYQNDTTGGMSGSPVYYIRAGCGICAMAIHAYGTYGSPPFSTNNHGTRITQTVFNNLIAWRNAP
jgi:glutamyl endopeptidase